MGLIDVASDLVDHVRSRLRGVTGGRNLAGILGFRGPTVRQGGIQPPDHVVRVEVARHGEDEARRMVVAAVKIAHEVGSDRFDGRLGRLLGREMVIATHQAGKLSALDAAQLIVAPLHSLQSPRAGNFKPLRVESGVLQHVEEHRQRCIQILPQAIDRRAARGRSDARRDLRGQKCSLLVELARGHRFRAARAHLTAGKSGQPQMLVGNQIAARAHGQRDRDQRQLMVFDQIRRRSRAQVMTVLVRRRRLEAQRRELQLPRMSRHVVRPQPRGGGGRSRRRAYPIAPIHRPPPARPAEPGLRPLGGVAPSFV